MLRLILVALLVHQALAQVGSGTACNKNADCPYNSNCQMPDHYNYPQMWPPCPHVGTCVCNSGFVFWNNGSCVPYVNLNLYDKCTNQIYELYRTPEQRCDGSKVICNTPTYVDQSGVCVLQPVATVAPIATVAPTCTTVGFLAFCDPKQCCGPTMTCTQKGSNATYSQCHCTVKTNIYDSGLGYCRPRVYGDICYSTDECASGLISNKGFECRLGRCRCQSGYEPVDNLYWNETSKTTYTRRICLNDLATNWVPTGQSCTMDPHVFADATTTRVCHQRAFCHLCQKDRAGYTVGQTTAKIGVCRELTCGSGDNCGNNGQCNNWAMQVDPPCQRGMCDCNWNMGIYKDRFSRCGVYENLRLGHRCIVPDNSTQLHPWYPNNEDWDDDKVCTANDTKIATGYAGYNFGVVKCKFPLIEDADGNCVRNDDNQNQWSVTLGYMQDCDDNDNRYPVKRCDAARGLTCQNFKCQCPSTQTCGAGYGGCGTSATSSPNLWDGNVCRPRGLGDACNTSSDCCGGTCNNGYCGCQASYTLLDYSIAARINNGDNKISTSIISQKYCFRNVTVVSKGEECHLDPITWNCGNYIYGWAKSYLPVRVCASGLTCLRCPADYAPDDEAFGICRSVQGIPDIHPPPERQYPVQPQGGQQGGYVPQQPGLNRQWINGHWVTGWSNWNSANTLSQSFVIAFLALFVAFF